MYIGTSPCKHISTPGDVWGCNKAFNWSCGGSGRAEVWQGLQDGRSPQGTLQQGQRSVVHIYQSFVHVMIDVQNSVFIQKRIVVSSVECQYWRRTAIAVDLASSPAKVMSHSAFHFQFTAEVLTSILTQMGTTNMWSWLGVPLVQEHVQHWSRRTRLMPLMTIPHCYTFFLVTKDTSDSANASYKT